MFLQPRRRAGSVCAVLLVCVSMGACTGGSSSDCRGAGVARVCLSRRSPARLTATGLEPGSPVATAIEGPKVDGGPAPRPLAAGADGHFPPAGVSSGLVFPVGSGPVTVTVTVTPKAGAPTTVTFHR